MSQSSDVKPTRIHVTDDKSVFVTALKTGTTNQYETVKYAEFKVENNFIVNEDGEPILKANEMIVRFKQSALNVDAIDNLIGTRQLEFGKLQEFLTPGAMADFDLAFRNLCRYSNETYDNPCGVQAVKIFKNLKSSYTTTVNRLGETISIPDFWTTLLLLFPEEMDLQEVNNVLNSLTDHIAYAEYNWAITHQTGANDSRYNSFQENLHPILPQFFSDTAHINIEEAWDVMPLAGKTFIKCGVIDEGIDFRHEDFGYDGINTSSSKVIKGWDFVNNQNLMTLNQPDFGHGTPCAGIIGALRNNIIGIAGIAGGDNSSDIGNKGVSLYALRVLDGFYGFGYSNSAISNVYDAIVTSAIDDPSLEYAFGLHLSSNSWGVTPFSFFGWSDSSIQLLREATHFSNRAQVTFVASRGNGGTDGLAYPATMDDDWILSVGGSGLNGRYKGYPKGIDDFISSYGRGMDVIAPSIKALVQSTKNGGGYQSFNKTSSASPHVSGVVGLLMSYLNEPFPDYKNLAPEDCERIIELSATDIKFPEDETDYEYLIGYDDYSGWGRLNAGRAMKLVEKPWNTVYHFGTNSLSTHTKSHTLVASNQTVHLKETYQNDAADWFSSGTYKVNVYRVDATVNHTLEPNDTIVAYWARPSSSTVLEARLNDSLLPRERVQITSCNLSACTMNGYIYEVFDLAGNPLGWWPFDTTASFSTFEYTILARNQFAPTTSLTTINGIDKKINLYPNPSHDAHTLYVNTVGTENMLVQLYDLQGKLISTLFDGAVQQNEWQTNSTLQALSPSMYYYKILLDEEQFFIRFIKQ